MKAIKPLKVNTQLKNDCRYSLKRDKGEIMSAIMTIGNDYYLTFINPEGFVCPILINNPISLFDVESSIVDIKISNNNISFHKPEIARTTMPYPYDYKQLEKDGREAFNDIFGFYPDDDFNTVVDKIARSIRK